MQVENCVKNRDNYAKAHLESRYSNYLYSYYNHTSHFSLFLSLYTFEVNIVYLQISISSIQDTTPIHDSYEKK